jgi:FkbM family methyltransferase
MSNRSLFEKARTVLNEQGMRAVVQKFGGLLKRIYREKTFKPYFVDKSFGDAKFKFLIGDIWGEDWYLYPETDKPEILWLQGHIAKGDSVADCGAHHGFMTMMFSCWVGNEGKVIAFEALPSNAEIIRQTLKINSTTSVELINAALGSAEGTLRFATTTVGRVHDSNGRVTTEINSSTVEVPATTLDITLKGHKLDVLKLDVEGYEIEVLKAAQTTIKNVRVFDIEIHCETFGNPEQSVTELLELLPLASCDAWLQLRIDGPLVPYDPALHTPQQIAAEPNVHLFAARR